MKKSARVNRSAEESADSTKHIIFNITFNTFYFSGHRARLILNGKN